MELVGFIGESLSLIIYLKIFTNMKINGSHSNPEHWNEKFQKLNH
jgi:hypothetical protein